MDISEKQKEGFITLKEASALSGYSADYIGQLIRKGKIDGKQVYANVAWMTTREAVQEYIDGENTRTRSPEITQEETSLLSRITASGVFVDRSLFFRTLLIGICIVSIMFLLAEFYLFSVFIDRHLTAQSEMRGGETVAAARALVASVDMHEIR